MLQYKIAKEDAEVIKSIARRAAYLAEDFDVNYSERDALMDITTCHANGCPLKLAELLGADNANFGHDVFGIRCYLDRETGELIDCFLPRFAA